MSRISLMPTLFGRATAVLGEHPSFDRAIHRLRTLTDSIGEAEAPPASEGMHLLDELIARMRAHFAAEEADYFATLVNVCPDLKPQISSLTREHEEFMQTAHSLRAAFARNQLDEELRSRLSSFIERFVAHERAETGLLQDFLGWQASHAE